MKTPGRKWGPWLVGGSAGPLVTGWGIGQGWLMPEWQEVWCRGSGSERLERRLTIFGRLLFLHANSSFHPFSLSLFPRCVSFLKVKRLYFSSFPTPHWRTCLPSGGNWRVEVGGPAATHWVIIPFFEACGFLVWKKKHGDGSFFFKSVSAKSKLSAASYTRRGHIVLWNSSE